MSAPEYDEATCITAAELRAQGIAVDEEVPDLAWVRRDSIRYRHGAVVREAGGRFSTTIGVEFTEPFRCIEIVIEQTAEPAS